MIIRVSNIPVSLDAMLSKNGKLLFKEIARALGVKPSRISSFKIARRSIDARKKENVHFVLTCDVELSESSQSSAASSASNIESCVGDAFTKQVPHKSKVPAALLHESGVVQMAAHSNDTQTALSGLRLAKGVKVSEVPNEKSNQVPFVGKGAHSGERPVVVGAGPAGLFCALYLARAGMWPILIERGEAVEERQKSVTAFNEGGSLDLNSNIQFGEGGAGTFSDGKLTTGTKDKHIRDVLREFVAAGAPEDILVDAKPHIGTDNLPTVVGNIRKTIIEAGGEVRFNTQLIAINCESQADVGGELQANAIDECNMGTLETLETTGASHTESSEAHIGGTLRKSGVDYDSDIDKAKAAHAKHIQNILVCNTKTGIEEIIACSALVLAIGHSARDTIEMLLESGLAMERKPFAMGVRIEHSQSAINKAQYGKSAQHPALPPADYKLNVRTEDGRGVYTFCMCPGGTVVAAASEEGGVCVNGMSNYARDGKNANSALLVEILPSDFDGEDVLAGMKFQRKLEKAAFEVAKINGEYSAPAQTVGDFLASQTNRFAAKGLQADSQFSNSTKHASSRVSSPCSCGVVRQECHGDVRQHQVSPTYPRGVAWINLDNCLPPLITDALTDALPKLDKKLKGFADPDAVMTAIEARSSSPVRIVRDRETLQSVSVQGIYPAGEGAGYAGGIMSAATDGIRIAEAIIRDFQLDEAARHLKNGDPVIFPTDTVCGIGVAVQCADSPQKLYELKSRTTEKPIAWLVGSLEDITKYGSGVPAYAQRLADAFWPGPLTLIVKASDVVPEQFRSAAGTLGMRMPQSDVALELIRRTDSPLATTSANVSGAGDAVDVGNIDETLLSNVPYVLYMYGSSAKPSASSSGIASTVIDCTEESPKILREGSITSQDIASVIS